MIRIPSRLGRATAAASLAAALLAAPLAAPASAAEVAPASPQPKAGALKPGLAVNYHFYEVREIKWLLYYAGKKKGTAGAPLPQINYDSGVANVLSSERPDGVGANIRGFIKLDKPGAYVFKVNSNDGVRLTLGGKQIFEDGGVHSDSMSGPIQVRIAKPGWYPIQIWYFERKGTSTLQLFWQPPGGGASVIVPASAFAHAPDG